MDDENLDKVQLGIYLKELERARMPFGKFGPKDYPPAGVPLVDLPLAYLIWFSEKEFPQGRLGELMEFTFQIKSIGAEEIFAPIRLKNKGRASLHKPRKSKDFGDSENL